MWVLASSISFFIMSCYITKTMCFFNEFLFIILHLILSSVEVHHDKEEGKYKFTYAAARTPSVTNLIDNWRDFNASFSNDDYFGKITLQGTSIVFLLVNKIS